MSDELHNRVAQIALDHFETELPKKGKPQDNEWTVYAAIVSASTQTDEAWVVASATGTKCTTERCNGCIVHDAHAEVLARRGLLRVLWNEIMQRKPSRDLGNSSRSLLKMVEGKSDTSLLAGKSLRRQFHLRNDLRLHLYVSDAPCGDASIYTLKDDRSDSSLQFTGAKVIVSNKTTVSVEECGGDHQLIAPSSDKSTHCLAREGTQLLGKLRSKSGRSNLEQSKRSSSMSCSDKLVRWGVLGLQGHVLSSFLKAPICLSSVVVSRDPRVANGETQLLALQRAVPGRIQAVQEECLSGNSAIASSSEITLPSIFTADRVFARGKAVMDDEAAACPRTAAPSSDPPCRKRPRRDKISFSPAGMSVHWQQSDPEVELLVGARGIRQGKKPKSPLDFPPLQSRLSRAALMELARQSGGDGTATTYQAWKKQVGSEVYLQTKELVLCKGPLAGWLDGSQQDDFTLVVSDALSSPLQIT